MNRREALTVVASAVTAAGLSTTDVKAKAVTSDDDVVLFVMECQGTISHETASRIVEYMDGALKGTPLEHVKCVVLGNGMKLRALTRKGFAELSTDQE